MTNPYPHQPPPVQYLQYPPPWPHYYIPYVDPYQSDANFALGWGIAALFLPLLLFPSIIAIVCGSHTKASRDPRVRNRGLLGQAFGWLGIIVPLIVFLGLIAGN